MRVRPATGTREGRSKQAPLVCWLLDLGLLASGPARNRFLCFISRPVCDIVPKQLKKTETFAVSRSQPAPGRAAAPASASSQMRRVRNTDNRSCDELGCARLAAEAPGGPFTPRLLAGESHTTWVSPQGCFAVFTQMT